MHFFFGGTVVSSAPLFAPPWAPISAPFTFGGETIFAAAFHSAFAGGGACTTGAPFAMGLGAALEDPDTGSGFPTAGSWDHLHSSPA